MSEEFAAFYQFANERRPNFFCCESSSNKSLENNNYETGRKNDRSYVLCFKPLGA